MRKINSAPPRIVSIDASSTSMAFAYFDKGKLVKYGKITFSGSNAYYRAGDACKKCYAFFKEVKADNVVIESAVRVNSAHTTIVLSIVQGAILGAAQMAGAKRVLSAAPLSWQSYIGNNRLTVKEKAAIRKKHPGKSQYWHKNNERQFRKQRTIAIVNEQFGLDIDDDDVADSIGVGWYALDNWSSLSEAPNG